MNDVKREAIARINALSDENECLRDMLNDIAHALGLDMSEVRYRSEDNYAECQNAVLYEIERRLMPKGMKWPCFENGELVRLGDKFVTNHGTCNEVAHITFVKSEVCELAPYGFSTVINSHGHEASIYFEGQRLKSLPVLDADGAEIHKGDTVYAAPGIGDDGWAIPYTVDRVHGGFVDLICDGESAPSLVYISGERLTHKQYVFAKDSKPIEVGQTLYGEDGVAWHVCALHPGERYEVESDSMPSLEIRADGTVRHKRLKAEWLTHEKPDTWERLMDDCKCYPASYCERHGINTSVYGSETEFALDLVRRAKKLAERGASV